MKHSFHSCRFFCSLVVLLFGACAVVPPLPAQTRNTSPFQMTGHVFNSSNKPIKGVGVSASTTVFGTNYVTATVDTDVNGNYTLQLITNGIWTVSVNCSSNSNGDSLGQLGYNCVDSEFVTLTNPTSQIGTANFIAPNIGSWELDGHLTDTSGDPIAGVAITATKGNVTLSATTDANGFYEMIVSNGQYTVSANCSSGNNSLDYQGYLCPDPENAIIASQNNVVNFVGFDGQVELDGYVLDSNGKPVAGVGVNASSGYYSQNITTDANGFFQFVVYNYAYWDLSVNCTNLNALGYQCASGYTNIAVLGDNVETNFLVQSTAPPFFTGQVPLGGGWFYLAPTTNNLFGFYSMYSFPYVYHNDMGYEYFIDAHNASHGAYFYDFTSGVFWYSDPKSFPYIYSFGRNAWLFYCPDSNRPGYYTSNPRWFYDYSAQQWTTNLAAH